VSSAAQTVWLVKNPVALHICLKLLTTPSAPLRNKIFIEAQPPLLENGGEWTRLATNGKSKMFFKNIEDRTEVRDR